MIERREETAEVWFHLGVACADQGKFEEARPALERAAVLAPGALVVLTRLGKVYRRLGRYANAIKCFDEVLRHQPTDVGAWTSKGQRSLNAATWMARRLASEAP